MPNRFIIQNSYEASPELDFVGSPRSGLNRIRTEFEYFFRDGQVYQNSYSSNYVLQNTYRGR